MLVMIPAIILAFSISDTVPAVIFTIYCVLVGLSDNILKPVLMGKGLKTPIIIILIGTIGGMLLHGIIGLFLGAVVLAVMHRLYLYWVHTPEKRI
jgi:predicted PurR-regulated permease PerM